MKRTARATPRNKSSERQAELATRRIARDDKENARQKQLEDWQNLKRDKRDLIADRFVAWLDELRAQGGDALERRLSVPQSTLQGWTQKGKNYHSVPSLEAIALLSDKMNVSIDWLCGASVPRRRSARAEIGVLAKALKQHVVKDYISRTKGHSYTDGITGFVNGKRSLTDPPGNVRRNAEDFLAAVCDWAFEGAERLEAVEASAERERVLDQIRFLEKRLNETNLLASIGRRGLERLRVDLLRAAVDPINPRSKAAVLSASTAVHNAEALVRRSKRSIRNRKEHWPKLVADSDSARRGQSSDDD